MMKTVIITAKVYSIKPCDQLKNAPHAKFYLKSVFVVIFISLFNYCS